MLATLRRLLLALVALAASTPDLIAGVVCNPNPDGSWTCSGDGSGYDPDQPTTVVTNIVGVCTNCVAMDPLFCDQLKNDLLAECSLISTSISNLRELKNDVSSQLEELQQFPDIIDMEGGWHFGDDEWGYVYDDFWKFEIEDKVANIRYNVGLFDFEFDGIEQNVSSINRLIGSINCSACTASFDGGGGGSGGGGDTPPGGGGGGGGSGSSSCPDCPCKEQLEALYNLLNNDFLPKVKRIDENVEKLKELVETSKNQLETTMQGFGNVTNLFNRLDDYVLDDFSNRVFQIRYDVNFIASNLAQKVQRIFIDQSYSNAQFYVRQDSDTPVEMADLDETLIPEGDMSKFDWGEFENLSWFTRVEYLLLKLNGVYVTTNNNVDAGVSDAEENQQEVEDSFSDFKSSVNGDIKTGFTQVGTSISTFFSSFNSAVSTQGDKVVEIQLMSNFIGQEPLMLNIDPDVADACRTISSLLWTVLFGFLLYKIMIYFWVVFVDTINWWVSQTQGFVK